MFLQNVCMPQNSKRLIGVPKNEENLVPHIRKMIVVMMHVIKRKIMLSNNSCHYI